MRACRSFSLDSIFLKPTDNTSQIFNSVAANWFPRRWKLRPHPRRLLQVNVSSRLFQHRVPQSGQARCLRFGAIGAETTTDDALIAVREALIAEPNGHSWSLAHVASSGRFA